MGTVAPPGQSSSRNGWWGSRVNEKREISRRQFLLGAAAAAGTAALSWMQRPRATMAASRDESTATPAAFLPLVARNSPALPFCGKVVQVHSDSVTDWTGENAYWDHVDQELVDTMVERGLLELTGAATVVDAWRALLPAYQPGEKIAIKVNFNNARACESAAPDIDALIEPVNAVAKGLIQMGVAAADICIYDAIRALPTRFAGGDLYGLSFFDGYEGIVCQTEAGFSYVPESRVTFHLPDGVTMPEEHVTDVLLGASYLLNMPIMKGGHILCGVTLGFKNHLGTIDDPEGLHETIDVQGQPPGYRTDYNPLVDLMLSPLIGGKTVLTIGDGLFAARTWTDPPVPWVTFGGEVPKSLFFATDPVAVDCVMHDLVVAEPGTSVRDGANNYLRLAAEAGLGVFEEGNPWQMPHGSGYQHIQYARVEV